MISIHALREEGDQFSFAVDLLPEQFLSTPSARRATRPHGAHRLWTLISIHALREEGDQRGDFTDKTFDISIHALREEGDTCCRCGAACGAYFYPRPPRGGRPLPSSHVVRFSSISIHALREEGDGINLCRFGLDVNFYPRPPRGGRRPAVRSLCGACTNFYPRPPRGGRQQKRRKHPRF